MSVDERLFHLHTFVPNFPTDTQVEAANRALPKSGTKRALVLEAIKHSDGMTDEDLQEALGMPPNTERPRRRELVLDGWIVDSGQRRKTATNSNSIVWVIASE